MADYVVVELDDAPEPNVATMAPVWLITADTPEAACTQIAAEHQILAPKGFFVTEASVFAHYTSTPSYSVSTAPG